MRMTFLEVIDQDGPVLRSGTLTFWRHPVAIELGLFGEEAIECGEPASVMSSHEISDQAPGVSLLARIPGRIVRC